MKTWIIAVSLLALTSCSFLKKQSCNEDRAYQAGYEAAKRGRSEAEAMKGAAQCQDF
ncbi:MAG: hypothetical protein MJK18_08025 [Bdellovibrionales bacterium]|nr:hypothetical protein [Bdellovibrionales bacterium]